MTNQWEIALQKVLEIEHFPRLYLTIKVIETNSAHPLSGPNIAKNADFKEISQDPTATVTDKEAIARGKEKEKERKCRRMSCSGRNLKERRSKQE